MASGPLALLQQVVEVLDRLGLAYALGGSMASSFVGEPRTTVDVDIAVAVDQAAAEEVLSALGADLYVPMEAARLAIRERSSFNLIDPASAIKVDVFVLGDELLDRMQLQRRVRLRLPGVGPEIWVSSAEDQVLRKLDWFRQGGGISDRQWRDILGILRVQGSNLDAGYLEQTAVVVGLDHLLQLAQHQVREAER